MTWTLGEEMKLDHYEEQFDQQIIKIIQHCPELAQRAGFLAPVQDALQAA
jgi:hypothetical protein